MGVKRLHPESQIISITCDVCEENTLDKESINFEYSRWIANWGYGSSHDMEHWDYYFCEDCSYLFLDVMKDWIRNLKRANVNLGR